MNILHVWGRKEERRVIVDAVGAQLFNLPPTHVYSHWWTIARTSRSKKTSEYAMKNDFVLFGETMFQFLYVLDLCIITIIY